MSRPGLYSTCPSCLCVADHVGQRQSSLLRKAVDQLRCFHRGSEGLLSSVLLAAGTALAATPGTGTFHIEYDLVCLCCFSLPVEEKKKNPNLHTQVPVSKRPSRGSLRPKSPAGSRGKALRSSPVPAGARPCVPALLLRPPLAFVLSPAAEGPSHRLHSHGNSGRRAALGGKGSPRGDKERGAGGGRVAPEKREESKEKRHRRTQQRSGATELGKVEGRWERTGAGATGAGLCAWPEAQEKRPERPLARPQAARPAGRPLPSGASEACTDPAGEAWLGPTQETPEPAERVSWAGVEGTWAAIPSCWKEKRAESKTWEQQRWHRGEYVRLSDKSK